MLGTELRKAREAAELTQEELSFEARLDRTYVSQLENDKKSPTIDVLFRICDALGITASELIVRVEKARPKGRHGKT
ncbi:MAG: helix-turn-helix domain-containing protein [Planctomycetaceae bacterium]|nr:helix-turn-helix domain-containing protein [Planctomycetaceae bacterium]